MEKIIVIAGPTGIGKTSFAIQCAARFNGEIVGADSMQIYQYLDIGTAKPTADELQQARHHLIDCIDPREEFDAGKYIALADQAIADIVQNNKVPIVAGGTGLYIKALLHGLFRSKSICQDTLDRLEAELERKGSLYLHQQLSQYDPAAARSIHPNDAFRVIRALEVYQSTGQKLSEHQKAHNFFQNRYQALKIGLNMDREVLYQRINLRVDQMIGQGLLDEVRALNDRGFDFSLKPMQSIGYKHMGLYLSGKVSFEEAVTLLKRDTRRYAKRQFTWFRKDPEIIWFDPSDFESAAARIKEFLT